jgi:UDP-N-acetylglucosamine--N-acetylmuramyl-(pentapeptide) pyrophosphoryl-undecaprenol N-acetylglucosamine transferase
MIRHVLACASAGGHFKQLLRLVDRLPDADAVTWLTYDSGLTDDLLLAAGRSHDRVVHAPYAAPRDVINLARDAVVAHRVLRQERFDLAISTGAGIAVAALPVARATGVRSVFVESATRADGPSMSGRILARTPGVELYTQNPGYGPRWGHVGSVHDEFIPGRSRRSTGLHRVVVTLGTIQPYGFRRLVRRLVELIPPEVDVLWQTGATDVSGLPIEGRVSVPAPELERAIREADVVIAHAGTGTALTAFELGRSPVLVPRRRAFDEHIDDHQVATARMLAGRGLATYAEVEDLDECRLEAAATRTVTRLEHPPALTL